MEEPTVVLQVEGGDRDGVGYARDGDEACVAILRVRAGKLLAREHRFMENIDGDDDSAVLAIRLDTVVPGEPSGSSSPRSLSAPAASLPSPTA